MFTVDPIEKAALFLLKEVPLNELPEGLDFSAKLYRDHANNQDAALQIVLDGRRKELIEWIKFNEEIDKELGSWKNI